MVSSFCGRVMMVRLVFLMAITGWCTDVVGQTFYLDSLKSQVDAQQISIQKADLLHQLSAAMLYFDFEESLRYAQQANEVSTQLNYDKGSALALSVIGDYYQYSGDYETARQFYQQAIDIKVNDPDFKAYTFSLMANLYAHQGMFDSAGMLFDGALKLIGNPQQPGQTTCAVYFNYGMYYESLSQFDLARDYIARSLQIRTQKRDSILMAECWASLAGIATHTFQYDSAEYYLQLLAGVVRSSGSNVLTLRYHSESGILHFHRGDYGRAIDMFSEALRLTRDTGYDWYHSQILKYIGQIFTIQGDFNRALEQYLLAMQLNEQINNVQEIARINGLVGRLYFEEQEDSLSLLYAVEAQDQFAAIDDKAGLASVYNLLGNISFRRGESVRALDYYSKALNLFRELRLGNDISRTLFNMGRLYYDQGYFAKAIEYHERILSLDHNRIDRHLLASIFNSMGAICIKRKMYDDAVRYLNEAQRISSAVGLPIQLRDNHKLFAELYEGKGDFKRAVQYYNDFIVLNDSIFSQEKISKTAQLSAVYQLSDKEKEIQLLNQENELKQSQLSVQQSKLTIQRNFIIFSIVCIILLSVLVYMMVKYYRAKHLAHHELTQLNRSISEKNEEIQAQAEELTEANASLSDLNRKLLESQEEIQAQSEELQEANEIISSVNRDLERKIRERTEQLKQAYVELDTFFYRSSHDFRRPLTTFLGLAEVAKVTVKEKTALELFERVSETAVNLDKMLIKLQSISDVGTQQLVYKEVLLREIILSIMDEFRQEIANRTIKANLDVNLTRSFNSYPALIKIIIENLVENSIYFCSKDNPFIEVKAYNQHDNVVIEIRDNGQGISAKLADRIFEMYFRANFDSKGNGLGLYIVKKAVEKLNGDITFKSQPEKGTVFIVTIPIQLEPTL